MIPKISNYRQTLKELQLSTQVRSRATLMLIFFWVMPAALRNFSFSQASTGVNNNYGAYGNDNWHITSKLTLNLGLRFDGMPHAFERFNQFANFVPADYDSSLGSPLNSDGTLSSASLTTFGGQPFYLNGIREANVNGFSRGVVKNKYNTFEPRVGFAYNVTGDGKTVLRGGFGMFFERVQGNDVYNAALNPPFAYQPAANNVYFSNPNTSALTGVTTSQSFPSTLTSLKYNYPSPGTAMFSLGVQHQLSQSVIAVLQYAGSIGWDQSDDRHINTLPLSDLTHTSRGRKRHCKCEPLSPVPGLRRY